MTVSLAAHRGIHQGLIFQSNIELVNKVYNDKKLAVITRKGVPGKFVNDHSFKKGNFQLSNDVCRLNNNNLASVLLKNKTPYRQKFIPESKAEPDYGGVVFGEGRGIFYDAKSTKREQLDFDNLHAHQIEFLRRTGEMGAISGFLVEFSGKSSVFFLPIQIFDNFFLKSGRKSIPYSFFEVYLEKAPPGEAFLLFDYLKAIELLEKKYLRNYREFSL